MQKLLLPLLALFLLSACSNKMSLVKRRYNKGFYVSSTSSKKSTTTKHATEHAVAKTTAQPAMQAPVSAEYVMPVVAQTPAAPTAVQNTQPVKATAAMPPATPAKSQQAPMAAAHKKMVSLVKPIVKPMMLPIQSNMRSSSGDDADARLIIMVILCLFWFINLIPVYMHDGKTITTNFWVTLVLDIFFILGIIFALLVVLDVIDLR